MVGRLLKSKSSRRGAIAVLSALLMIFMVGMLAFAVDVGYIALARTELQNVADFSALAGASQVLDRNVLKGGTTTSARIIAVSAEAQKYAQFNKAGSASISLASNAGNSSEGDLVVGYLANPSDPDCPFVTSSAAFNAVSVTARRNGENNGSLPLFFASVFGRGSADVAARAVAVYEGGVLGFQITGKNPKVTHSKLLPFALHIDSWTPVVKGIGSDAWSYNATTKAVSAGSDGIREVRLYGAKLSTPGNFGTVNIGNPNNSTNDMRRLILEGPNQQDFAYHGGKVELGPNGTLALKGDPGLSAGFKDALEAIIGQPRSIPIYRSISGNGSNASFVVVGFAGVIITEVNLTGPDKSVVVQPEYVIDPTAIGGSTSPSISDFVYRPLRLAR